MSQKKSPFRKQASNLIGFAALLFVPLSLGGGASAQDNIEPGIIDPFQSRLSTWLWRDGEIEESLRLLRDSKASDNNAVNRTRALIALSQSRPKLSFEDGNNIMAARLELLYDQGILDGAEALAAQVEWTSPAVRTIGENIALMTGRPDSYCAALLSNKYAPIMPGIKVYCLARQNAWLEGKLLYELENSEYDDERRAALSRFLDVDDGADPALQLPWQTLPQPLAFVADEALGRPRGAIDMPPAYQYYILERGTTPREKIILTESLTRLAALPSNVLFSTYSSYKAAESGGPWGRAEAVQALMHYDYERQGYGQKLDTLVDALVNRFSEARLLDAVSGQFAPYLGDIELDKVENPSTRNEIVRLALMGNWSQAEWSKHIARDDFQQIVGFKMRHPEVEFGNLLNYNLPTRESQILKTVFVDVYEEEIPPASGAELLAALEKIDNFLDYSDAEVIAAFRKLIGSGQTQLAKDIGLAMLFGGSLA